MYTDFEDSPYITITITGSQNLLTGERFSIEIRHVQKKAVPNKRYNIYIQAEHPNMTLEVPIFGENFYIRSFKLLDSRMDVLHHYI